MTEVLHSPSHFPSDALVHSQTRSYNQNPNSNSVERGGGDSISSGVERESEEEVKKRREKEKEREELSFLALILAVFRKSLIACTTDSDREAQLSADMDIGSPTNVRHVAHVTFDRFDGFLGLPVEFELEVPRRAPSASTSVFGVSTESMQLSYDSRGNCVPVILILMQRRLYSQGGLQEEGIFRITADNSQEELVRDQLNRGIIPDDIDIHCLAGLIKAWFRELPTGVLDPLSPEELMRCETEEDCTQLVRQLPPTEAALLDWAINLMADIVEQEHYNKMNEHNIATVFAPNMTQMADPLTALMYAVQVMNFLKTLITKTLRNREQSRVNPTPPPFTGPSDENGHQSPSLLLCLQDYLGEDTDEVSDPEHYSDYEPGLDGPHETSKQCDDEGSECDDSPFHLHCFKEIQTGLTISLGPGCGAHEDDHCQSSGSGVRKDLVVRSVGPNEKPKSLSNVSRISSRIERIEAWR